MNKIFMGFLAVAAIALMVSQAIADGANNDNNNGTVVIETYTASAVAVPIRVYNSGTNGDMQPLPDDPGVEVAPINDDTNEQPVAVEEDILIQQTGGND